MFLKVSFDRGALGESIEGKEGSIPWIEGRRRPELAGTGVRF